MKTENSKLTMAIGICLKAHTRQFDLGGEPYCLHPMRIMFFMETEDEKITALLHDVIEDSPWTLKDLENEHFSADVINAVDALTKRKGEPASDYYSRIAGNAIARKVKIQDLKHNMDISRIKNISDKDHERLEKYKWHYEYLTKIS